MALAKWPNEATMTSKHNGNEWADEDKHQLGVSKGKEWQELENPRNADGDSSKWSHNHFSNAPTPQNPAPHLLVPKATRIASPTSPLATNHSESTSSSPPHQLVAKTPCIASPGGTCKGNPLRFRRDSTRLGAYLSPFLALLAPHITGRCPCAPDAVGIDFDVN